jgi:signal transduction histidine kinase
MAGRLKPLRKPRFELFGKSLSGRVLWLTVGIIMLVEFMILLPSLGRERQTWLWEHLQGAHLAAVAAARSYDGAFDPVTRDSLLRLSDTQSIRFDAPGQLEIVLVPEDAAAPARLVDLDTETLAQSTWRALLRVVDLNRGPLEVVAASPLQSDATLDVVVNGDELASYLRGYAGHVAVLSVIIAMVTGLLVFAALDRQLVRPMRIMTESIAGFRRDPEHEQQNQLAWLAGRPDNEISSAARELKEMQEEMRAALWRNARLAAVGTAVAKISHDLRNILTSALLVADRLQETSDPIAKRAANTLIPAVERAAQLVSRTVDFAREGPPPVLRSAVALRELVDEVAQAIRPMDTGAKIENLVPDSLVLPLDRSHIYRVLLNLMRNAAEAGAQKITLSVKRQGGVTRMSVADNGPGLPLRVQDNLFRPFTGSGRHGGTGLGLAIARDLIRAHGGELMLAQTSSSGTVFVMELALSEVAMPEANRLGFALPALEPQVRAAPEVPVPVPVPEVAAEAPPARPARRRVAAKKAEPEPVVEPRLRPANDYAPELVKPPLTGLNMAAPAARRRRGRGDKLVNPVGIEGVPSSRN